MSEARVEWADPPPRATSKGNSKWLSVIAELQAHPGQWAKIVTYDSRQSAGNLAAEIRRGSGHWRPQRTFEATARGNTVYARYVGRGAS